MADGLSSKGVVSLQRKLKELQDEIGAVVGKLAKFVGDSNGSQASGDNSPKQKGTALVGEWAKNKETDEWCAKFECDPDWLHEGLMVDVKTRAGKISRHRVVEIVKETQYGVYVKVHGGPGGGGGRRGGSKPQGDDASAF